MDNSKKDFAERLNIALDARKFPPIGQGRVTYVHKIFSVTRMGANNWIHGKSIPHRNKRVLIAEKLKINLEWLEVGLGEMFDVDKDIKVLESTRKVYISTPENVYSSQYASEESTNKYILCDETSPQDIFVMIVSGSSMQPIIESGDYVIVSTDYILEDGDYVIVKSEIMPEAMVRQYVKGHSSDYLVATNRKFPPIKLDSNKEDIIIGKVTKVEKN